MIHTSQQSVRKQKTKTFPSTDEPDLKTSCTGQQHRISTFYFKLCTKRQQRIAVDSNDELTNNSHNVIDARSELGLDLDSTDNT
jgi:hypothetical protein